MVCGDVLDALFINQDWILVLGLALYGMALVSHSITINDDAWRQVVSSVVCSLAHCVSLVVVTPSGAWLYHGV